VRGKLTDWRAQVCISQIIVAGVHSWRPSSSAWISKQSLFLLFALISISCLNNQFNVPIDSIFDTSSFTFTCSARFAFRSKMFWARSKSLELKFEDINKHEKSICLRLRTLTLYSQQEWTTIYLLQHGDA
jgi:hypothetical protein